MSKHKPLDFSNPEASKKAFRTAFEKLAYTQSYSTVFGDFVEFALLMLNLNKQAKDFKDLEARWPKQEDQKLFAEMFFHWGNASCNFHDALGDLFMECVSFGRNGQFFTPEPLCEMMAIMQISKDVEDGKSVMDCACGSGRTLLAAAKINRNLKFYGADNDVLCAKMTAINFIVNTMVGEVAHMNSLTLEHYKSWHIRKILSGTHYIPYYYVTGPGQTDFLRNIRQNEVDEDACVPQPVDLQLEISESELKVSKHNQLILF